MPGAGWGVLDSQGMPKAAYWFLKRALAPRAVWTTDEGLNGIDIHVANDHPSPLDATLRVALYQHGEQRVAHAESPVSIDPRETRTFGVEQILGRFVDAAYAYKFGPPGHDVIAVSLHNTKDAAAFAQTFRLLPNLPPRRPIADLGLTAQASLLENGTIRLSIASLRFAWGVRAAIPGWLPDDAYFGIEPGTDRHIHFHPLDSAQAPPALHVTAANAEGRLRVEIGSAR
jgi:beta-mannosidase